MHDDENYRYVTKKGIIDLTFAENCILKILIENKGKILKCNRVDIRKLISRLRNKLEEEIKIKTKNGVGYYID